MPVKINPIKILTDLGYEMVDIESDEDYLSALMEAIVTLQKAGASGRARADVLQEELIRVRKERKAAAPSAGMKVTQKKISTSKFFDKKEQKSPAQGKGGAIIKIGNSVTSIVETLKEDQKQDKKQQGWFRKTLERFKRRKKENKLEFKIFDGIKKTATKLLAPMKNAWEAFLGFIGKVILGRILFKILKWMGNKDNQSKLQSIIKFFEDWWPTMLAAYLLFGNAFGRMAVKMGVMVARFGVKLITKIIPQLIKGLAKMKMGKLLKNIPGGGKFAPLIQGGMMIGGGMLVDNMMTGGDAQDFSGEFDGIQQEFNQGGLVQHFKQGGFVSGPGGVDKVPARLTAGEFVMSKGAVQKYGANTLAAMNAAGGGTNRPTMGRYETGGFIREKIAKARQVATDYGNAAPGRELDPLVNFAMDQMKEMYGITNTIAGSVSDGAGGFRMQSQQELNEENNAKLPFGMKMTEDGQNIDWGRKAADQARMAADLMKDPKYAQRLKEVGKQYGYENLTAEQFGDIANQQGSELQFQINRMIPGTESHRLDVAANEINQSTAQFAGGGPVGFLGGIGNIMGGKTWGGEAVEKESIFSRFQPRKTATVITPSEKKKVTVAYEEEKKKSDAKTEPIKSEQKIPQFDVTLGRSSKKIKVLGISV